MNKNFFLVLFTLLIISKSWAQGSLFDLSLEELMNISVVTTSKTDERLLDAPSAITVITRKELEILKCVQLSECLEFVTGISTINGEGNTLVNYNTNTLMLLDGIPVYDPYHSRRFYIGIKYLL